jgi:RNA polymerase sigma-70 factor, ECF subfamily
MSTVLISEPAQEFEAIFKEHARLVYRTAYGVTGSHEDAEDVLQTIFLQLIRRHYPPDLGTNPEAYLYRAAVNSSLNIIRHRRRDVLVDDIEHFQVSVPTDSTNSELEARRLYEAIAELKPEAAQIVILRYMHNKSDAEIARMLGKPRGTIALKLFRSRARLKKLLLAAGRRPPLNKAELRSAPPAKAGAYKRRRER